MSGPETELDASAAVCVSLTLSMGMFHVEDLLRLALAEPGLPDDDTGGVAGAETVPALAVGTEEFDAGALTWGATGDDLGHPPAGWTLHGRLLGLNRRRLSHSAAWAAATGASSKHQPAVAHGQCNAAVMAVGNAARTTQCRMINLSWAFGA
ncbi:hypothetical protein [Paenarthrobacter sp. MSM-2-10-13]|uniref:hypothetical protein n=1 Tax=Paenarthrobacter sp. MSM-2-10-13 TaxID=2717318 RepID=UPI001AA1D41F|nr:hypothetical protein [Paenarthrobacter sp. MSM-2-10-13]